MSPQLLLELRYLALIHKVRELPSLLYFSFPTLEWESLFLRRGYQTHLQALHVWLEMELTDHLKEKSIPNLFSRGSFSLLLNPLGIFTYEKVTNQRLQWITTRLVQTDPRNLFYRWLLFKAHGLLNRTTTLRFLMELLKMPQFPDLRTPNSCDRKADYLWQRDTNEYAPKKQCDHYFNGSDYLWMVSLLISHDGI